MITPTVGRVVWLYPNEWLVQTLGLTQKSTAQPMAAQIVYVWSDRLVNVAFYDHAGRQHHATSVALLQDNDIPARHQTHCAWMPYQIGQAARVRRDEATL